MAKTPMKKIAPTKKTKGQPKPSAKPTKAAYK
jgi:hypothetical protein